MSSDDGFEHLESLPDPSSPPPAGGGAAAPEGALEVEVPALVDLPSNPSLEQVVAVERSVQARLQVIRKAPYLSDEVQCELLPELNAALLAFPRRCARLSQELANQGHTRLAEKVVKKSKLNCRRPSALHRGRQKGQELPRVGARTVRSAAARRKGSRGSSLAGGGTTRPS